MYSQQQSFMRREAINRLNAPLVRYARGWQEVWLTEPDGVGMTFYPRKRRTWTLHVKGYPVVRVYGKVVK